MSEASPVALPGEWTARKVILVTLSVLAVVFGFGLLLRFYAVIFILFVALVLSIAIRPATDWLRRVRLPAPVAVIVVYLALLVAPESSRVASVTDPARPLKATASANRPVMVSSGEGASR